MIDPLPAGPQRSDPPAVFVAKADAMMAALPIMINQINATAAGFDVTLWVSGTTYAQYALVYSPTDLKTYRRISAGAGSIDPYTDSANWAPVIAVAMPSGVGRGIAGRTNSVSPNTKIDISADSLVVRNSNGFARLLDSVAVTVNMATVGANGIDAGAQAASTWYYGWVIAKDDGTVAGLASTSATAPTMPSGYTFKALVSAVYSSAGTTFTPYRQKGDRVFYEAAYNVLGSGSASTETAISVVAAVPPIAESFNLQAHGVGTASGAGAFSTYVYFRIITAKEFSKLAIACNASDYFSFQAPVECPNIGTLYYLLAGATNVASIAIHADILSFRLPIG